MSDSKSKSRVILVSLIVFVICCILISIGLILVLTQTGEIDLQTSYYAKNSVEELELYTKDSLADTLEAFDFSNFSKDNPQEIINPLKLNLNNFNTNHSKLEFFNLPEDKNLAGKTISFALDFDAESAGSTDYSDSEGKYIIMTDVSLTFPQDFNQELWDQFTKHDLFNEGIKLPQVSSEQLKTIIPDIKVVGSLDVYSSTKTDFGDAYPYSPYSSGSHVTDLKVKLEFYFVKGVIFIKIKDLEVPEELKQDETVKKFILAEEKMIRIDMTSEYDKYIDMVIGAINRDNPSSRQSLSEFINDSFMRMTEEDEDFMRNYGNGIRDILVNSFQKMELFSNTTAVEPIRKNTDTVCNQADINFNSIIENTKSAIGEINELTGEDNQIRIRVEDFNQAQTKVQEGDVSTKLRLCRSNTQKYINGMGLEWVYNIDTGYATTKSDGNFDFLLISLDSNQKVTAPDYDVDLTDEVSNMLDV